MQQLHTFKLLKYYIINNTLTLIILYNYIYIYIYYIISNIYININVCNCMYGVQFNMYVNIFMSWYVFIEQLMNMITTVFQSLLLHTSIQNTQTLTNTSANTFFCIRYVLGIVHTKR